MQVRQIVIQALHRSIQILDDPQHGKAVLGGGDLEFKDIEIDSLSRFEFIMHIEEALDLDLDDDDVTIHNSLNGLIEFIEERYNTGE